jgi:hypothetical protein
LAKGEPYLSPETERSEEPSTLPPPELNPLLNPLLAENMGRWAQVYFTSPPEKRDEAVHELLRELEAENSMRAEAGVAAAPSSATSSSGAPSSAAPSSISSSSIAESVSEPGSPHASQVSEVHTTLVRCHACGRKNPSTQRFCGLCGTRLGEGGAVAELHRDDRYGEDTQTAGVHSEHVGEPSIYEPRLNSNELSLFQSGNEVDYYNDEDSDQILSTPGSSGSYRIYIGIVVVIFIGALAYVAWRSQQSSLRTTHVESPAPSAIAEEPVTPAPAPSSPSKIDTPDSAASAEKSVTGSSRDAARPGRKEVRRAALAAQRFPGAEKSPPRETLAGSGADELAVAQGYLNGTNGQGRNSTEAAKWLWKAIAKHNAPATFLLSEMYLKGDGVSKNCDQARVLLDAATLKGVKGAGERLRHLQAFGCQ